MTLTTDFIINNYDGSKTVFTPDIFDFYVSVNNFSTTDQTIDFIFGIKNKETKQTRPIHTVNVTKDGQQFLTNQAAIDAWYQSLNTISQEINSTQMSLTPKQQELNGLERDENGDIIDTDREATLTAEIAALQTTLDTKQVELNTLQANPVSPEYITKNKFADVMGTYVDLQALSLNEAGWEWVITEAGYAEFLN